MKVVELTLYAAVCRPAGVRGRMSADVEGVTYIRTRTEFAEAWLEKCQEAIGEEGSNDLEHDLLLEAMDHVQQQLEPEIE